MSGPRTAFRTRRRALVPIALALAAFPAAAHATVSGEQVDRGDGPAGATFWLGALPWSWSGHDPQPQPLLISDDGRYAVLSYPSSSTTTGLYRRDVQLNTLRLIIDDVTATGATANRTKLSVITKRSLSSADTNTTEDLYLVDPFSGAATLASADASGKAVGGVTKGAVTSDGSAVVFSTAAGTVRRDLATGATAVTAGVSLAQNTENASDDQFTPDGRTFVASDHTVRTPARTVSVAEDSALAQSAVRIAAGGTVAVASLGQANPWDAAPADAGTVRVYSLTDGSRRTVRPQMPTGWTAPTVLAVSADGKSATIGSSTTSSGVTTYALGKLDLATGAITKTSDDMPAQYPAVLSKNGRYGLAPDGNHLFAVPAVVGATLPGGIDGASPFYYLGYQVGCSDPEFFETDGGRPHLVLGHLTPATRGWGLPINYVTFKASVASTGALMNAGLLWKSVSKTAINGYYGSVRVDATATFANGTSAAARNTIPAYTPDQCYHFTF